MNASARARLNLVPKPIPSNARYWWTCPTAGRAYAEALYNSRDHFSSFIV